MKEEISSENIYHSCTLLGSTVIFSGGNGGRESSFPLSSAEGVRKMLLPPSRDMHDREMTAVSAASSRDGPRVLFLEGPTTPDSASSVPCGAMVLSLVASSQQSGPTLVPQEKSESGLVSPGMGLGTVLSGMADESGEVGETGLASSKLAFRLMKSFSWMTGARGSEVTNAGTPEPDVEANLDLRLGLSFFGLPGGGGGGGGGME